MSDKFKEKIIGDMNCRVNQFTGTVSFKLFIELVQLVGPAFGSLLSSTDNKTSLSNMLSANVGDLQVTMLALMAKLNPDNNLDLILRMFACTTVNGEDVNSKTFDTVFQGKILTMFKVLLFVVEVNYQDFLGESGFEGFLNQVTPPPENTKSTLNS